MNEPFYSAKSCTVYSSVRISSLYCVSYFQLGLENRKTVRQQVSLRKRRAMPLKIYRVHLLFLFSFFQATLSLSVTVCHGLSRSVTVCHGLSLHVFRPKRKAGPRGSGLSHDQLAPRRDVDEGLPDSRGNRAWTFATLAFTSSSFSYVPARPLAGFVANATGGAAFRQQCLMKWY